jgi:hypothetical protein
LGDAIFFEEKDESIKKSGRKTVAENKKGLSHVVLTP